MDEHHTTDGDEPLFLDEPPDAPSYRQPPQAPVEELFSDETAAAQNPPAADPVAPKSAPGSQRALPGTGNPTLAVLFIVAAVLGFTAASFWLR
jgi:hypothetical protein